MPPAANTALDTATKIKDVAKRLIACADTLQTAALDAFKADRVPQDELLRALSEGSQLRALAEHLLNDAANSVVEDLELAQSQLTDTIDRANKTLAKIDKIRNAIDLAANLLLLVGAVNAGQPQAILSALNAVRGDLGQKAIA